jgi:SAM-dependent methyltransferase
MTPLLDRLRDQRRIWSRKPQLARLYAVWFDALLDAIPNAGRVLEVGAGPGFFSPYATARRPDLRWIASDLAAAPWNDLAADALRLPFRTASVDAIAGLDVLHHFAHPGDFLAGAARVLRPGGTLALVEPAVTPLSFPIYRWLHQEGCTLGIDPWDPFGPRGRAGKDAFDGDAAIPWKILKTAGADEWRRRGFQPPEARKLNAFGYLLSLGFRDASLLPAALVRPMIALDRTLRRLSGLFALRIAIVWTRLP